MSRAALNPPSAWVQRFAPLIAARGQVLDLACGSGRHARWLAKQGFRVLAVDKDPVALELLAGIPLVRTRQADLESGPWPLAGQRYDGVVVTHYLFRPRLRLVCDALGPGGVLIYETFMAGNERFGRPSNPDFLLAPNELLERLAGEFSVLAFEQGEIASPRPAMVQRICALKGLGLAAPLPA